MNKTFSELSLRNREIETKLADKNLEAQEREALMSEYSQNIMFMDDINAREQNAKLQREQPQQTADEWMREQIKNVREGKQREIVFGGTQHSIENSDAIAKNIHQLIDTMNEGLNLPAGLVMVSGVTGNDLWPVSVNDAEMEEVGENVALTDQDLDFDNLTCTPHRAGVAIDVSNKALDQAAFDVAGFVGKKIALAKRKYLAQKIYSQAAFTGNKGPFSGLASSGTITLNGGTAYADILKAVAAFVDKGFTGAPCLVMDAVTEAELKATPKAAGQGGFIIENGKCAGYDYVVSHYINTELNSGGTGLKPTADKYLGIGYWNYLQVQQHGNERLTKDESSKAVAITNKTAFVYNTEFSITDLSVKINKKSGTTTQAFALYKLA